MSERMMKWANDLTKGVVLTMTMAAGAQGAVTKAAFGTAHDGQAVSVYTIKTDAMEVKVMTYGARVISLKTADRNGKMGDVVLGYNTLAEYEADKKTYFGSIVGRYGNRIAKGHFELDGKSYQTPKNDNGLNMLHGGTTGFDSLVWTGKELPDGVEMTLVSKDGDQGFPGTLTAHVRYTVKGSALHIDYSATSDKATVVNLTNHTYFVLAGEGNSKDGILDEKLTINADRYTPVDSGLIPTGELASVAGTPFDFRKPTVIGSRINDSNEQLKLGGGYDHNWVLNGPNGQMKLAAKVEDPTSGRVLTVTTTQPGVQFYTGNFLAGATKGRMGEAIEKHAGLCLETQHFPDSPNQPAFPSTTLKPGETMHSATVFTFSTEK